MVQKQEGGEFAVYVERYSLPGNWQAVLEESGMNNTTRMIYADKAKFVLRVYDNHRDTAIVSMEHELLVKLQQAGLTFQVPLPIANVDGETVTASPGGKLAALYGYIEGTRPVSENIHHVESLGRAAGELSHALAAISDIEGLVPVYKPYYAWQETHAAMDADALTALCLNIPLLANRKNEVEELLLMQARLTTLNEAFRRLPHQWIHGDIVFTNAVANGDEIVGLLDFEFCTVDLRAMEIAVVLAEFPSDNDGEAKERIEVFCRGFGSQTRLTEQELRLLPDLIQLRMLDVWLHFAGRLQEGLDPAAVWLGQIDRVHFVCGWIEHRRAALAALFTKHLGASIPV
ncbi:phosphotransferase [Paenibacillus sp. R14(2021)]|uniref:phosphotransferase n=1 Tax=Paenibacillus sp. R14(2021) TaxID=2859228 RepID=UPI001C614627|nr:phosphotransferase [Paenibacillus sp. R14(2021)]